MHSGDTRVLELTITDEADAVVNLTGAAITWALSKRNASEVLPKGTAILTKTVGSGITITDAANGRADVAIDPADTADLKGEYYHEVQLVLTDTSTVLYGLVTIQEDLI